MLCADSPATDKIQMDIDGLTPTYKEAGADV
jgi:hypothetical protein